MTGGAEEGVEIGFACFEPVLQRFFRALALFRTLFEQLHQEISLRLAKQDGLLDLQAARFRGGFAGFFLEEFHLLVLGLLAFFRLLRLGGFVALVGFLQQ